MKRFYVNKVTGKKESNLFVIRAILRSVLRLKTEEKKEVSANEILEYLLKYNNDFGISLEELEEILDYIIL